MLDATQDHPLIVKKERSATTSSIGEGTPPKVTDFARPRKNSLPTYDKAKVKKSDIELLEGERIVTKIPHVALLRKGEIALVVPRGELYLTNYQLVYKPSVATFKKHGVYYLQKNNATSTLHANSTYIQQHIIRNMACEEIRVPFMLINFCRKKSHHDNLKIKTYDMRELRFTFSLLENEQPKFVNSILAGASLMFLPPSPSSGSLDQDPSSSSSSSSSLSSFSSLSSLGDVDLGSSLTHLHTSLRTIGVKNTIANGYHASLNLPSEKSTKGDIGGGMSGAKVAEKVFDYIMRFTNLQGSSDLFAFRHKLLPTPDQFMDGWFVYDPIKEFTRMGIPDAGWTISGINNSYELCPTYPPFLAIPRMMSDPLVLRKCAEFRSKGRLPTLSWKSTVSPATITRCSQPLVGYKGARCPEDEMLVAKILELNPASDELYIIDARPKVNALANQAGGEGGWESVNVYKSCKILFMGLENIHIIRDSFNKLFTLINQQGSQVSWETELDGSGWLKHIRAILLAAREVTATIAAGKSVMVHCSDGWDRTALISALAQLCLDPYYRTTRGFEILIEKEWLSFGHKFADRTGHQEGQKMTSSEKSPVFLQFMDCVSQFLYQFPTSFQFSNSLLVLLADQVYSSRFGTFLCNSDCERMRQSISSRTVSIWTYINANNNQFVNPFYDEKETSTLFISCSPQSIILWSAFYLRHHPPFSSSKNLTLPNLASPRLNLDNISYSIPSMTEAGGGGDKRGEEGVGVRGSVAFLNKPSLNVYPLNAYDNISWSPMALVEKRAREMAIQIQQLENELQQIRKSRAKGGNFTEFASFLRIPKPTPAANKQALMEAKHTIELILLKTFDTLATRQVFKRSRHNNIQIGGRSISQHFNPSPPATPRPVSPAAPSPPSLPHSPSPPNLPHTPPAVPPRTPRTHPNLPGGPGTPPRTPPTPTTPSGLSVSASNIPFGNSGSYGNSTGPKQLHGSVSASAFTNVSQMKPPVPPKNRSLSSESIVSPANSTPQSPPPWIRDSYSTCCEMCGKGFTKVWRKHHCRSCGMIFCGNCTKRKIAIPAFQYFHPVRVCDSCYSQLTHEKD